MNPKKDEYMRGYSDGFKDGMAAQQASLAAETIDLNARLGMSEGLKADARARAEMVPELLEALKAMVLNDSHTYRDCHKAALAAIAKASQP